MGAKKYIWRERVALKEKHFPKQKYGTHISQREAITRLKSLRKEEYMAKTGVEKRNIRRERRYLSNFFGVKKY